MNAALIAFLLIGSASVVAVVYALAGQMDEIDDKTQRELCDTFPSANPPTSAESTPEALPPYEQMR